MIMNVDVKCQIAELVQNIYSKYQFGVLSCEYSNSIEKLLQILHDKDSLIICEPPCNTIREVVCTTPQNIQLDGDSLTWLDSSDFSGDYRLEVIGPQGMIVYNSIISYTEIASGVYSTSIPSVLEIRPYRFLLYKICEEGIENGPATGCAFRVGIPGFTSVLSEITPYKAVISYPGLYLDGGILTATIFKGGAFVETVIVSGDLILLDLEPEMYYSIQYTFTLDGQTSCPLENFIFNTPKSPYKYYNAKVLECQQCIEKEDIYVKIPSDSSLAINNNYITLSNILVKIKSQVFTEVLDAEEIEYLSPVTCEFYCDCKVGDNLVTLSKHSLPPIECNAGTNIFTQCLNCN